MALALPDVVPQPGNPDDTPGDSTSKNAFKAPKLPNRGERASYALPPQPTPDELLVANRVRSLFQMARDYRRPLVQDWNRHLSVLENRTWLTGRPAHLPAPEIPEVYPIIATIVGYITDTRPTFDSTPASPPGSPNYPFWMDLCQDLDTVVQSVHHAENFESEIEKVVWDTYVYGTGIIKTTWDQSLDGGLGNARMDRVNPYCFYPDPHATNTSDGAFYLEVRTMSIQELDRRYPHAGEKMRSRVEDHDREPDALRPRSNTPMANTGAITGTGHTVGANYAYPGNSRMPDPTTEAGVTVIEAWVREHRHIANPDETSRADQPTVTVEGWRCIVVAGERVLLDCSAEDLWGHPEHPYDRYVQHEMSKFWGQSMVELLTPAQIAINRCLAAIQHNLELLGNPILLEPTRGMTDRAQITNKPGQRLRFGDGGEPKWLEPPPIHPVFMEMIQFYIGEMERISGLTAMSRGATPTGRNSADVLNQVQESSFVRIRMALRNLEYTLTGAYTKLAALMVQNYSIPRVVAIAGPSGERTSLALRSRHFHKKTDSGAIPLRFQITINAGSSMPISRSALAEKANMLFQMGAIDEQALLEAHEWPNWRYVLQRVMATRQAMMTAQPPPA